MSKVIRIDDETFARLQNLAEPFIDTPSSVVERLLNYYESRQAATHSSRLDTNTSTKPREENRMVQNLFLAPASNDNLKKTIKKSINISSIEQYLTKEEFQTIKSCANNPDILHCWAMTESNRTKYNEMSLGDIVLFSEKGSGKFQYFGQVVAKIENERLGGLLWEFVPNKPWSLIYFLEDIKIINIEKSKLVSALGYNKQYVVPGIIKINQVARDTILSQYGSFQLFLDTFTA